MRQPRAYSHVAAASMRACRESLVDNSKKRAAQAPGVNARGVL
jgi:hypothetical protein